MVKNNVFEDNEKKTVVVVIVCTLLLIDVAAANVYRLSVGHNFHDNVLYEQQRIEHLYRIKSDVYHHDLKKNIVSHPAAWGGIKYRITTDSLGFKSKEPSKISVTTDNYRILFMGDSFTEGVGVEYEQTFVGKIANEYANFNIDVLNAGVVGYSPNAYYRKTKYLLTDIGLKVNELIVFIDISDPLDEVNVFSNTNEFSQDMGHRGIDSQVEVPPLRTPSSSSFVSTESLKLFVADNSLMTYFLINRIYDNFRVRRDGYNLNMRQSLWTIDGEIYKEYGELGLSQATYHMDLLYDLLKQNEVALTIAVYPWPDQIVNHDLNSIQVKHWQTWANQKEVEFLNYFPSFIQDGCDDECRYKVLDDYFINGDVHWNERGHKLIAETFLSTKSIPELQKLDASR